LPNARLHPQGRRSCVQPFKRHLGIRSAVSRPARNRPGTFPAGSCTLTGRRPGGPRTHGGIFGNQGCAFMPKAAAHIWGQHRGHFPGSGPEYMGAKVFADQLPRPDVAAVRVYRGRFIHSPIPPRAPRRPGQLVVKQADFCNMRCAVKRRA